MKQARTFREMIELFWAGCKAPCLAILLESRFVFNWCRKRNANLLREQISLCFNHQNFPVILITCRRNQIRPAFLLVKGLPVYQDKQLLFSRLARSLALLGFHVLIYEDPGLNSCDLEAKTLINLRGIINSISVLSWIDRNRIMIGGSDFAARFLLTLFQDPEINSLSRGLIFFSAVQDLDQLRKYAFSGRLKIHQSCKYLKPAMETQIVFLWNNIRHDCEYKLDKSTARIIKNIILHRIDIALQEIDQIKAAKLRAMLLSALQGDLSCEAKTYARQVDYGELQEKIFGTLFQADLKKPVFLLHDIGDRAIDAGQSVELFDWLNSSAGVYLYLSRHLCHDRLSDFWKNPAGKLHSMARFAHLFLRIFAILSSDKNLPYNPESKILRYRM
jgi:hypothetical protein